jgi:type II secretory pathway component PulF
MYERLKSDKSGLTGIESTVVMGIILGILLLAAVAVLKVFVIPKFTSMFDDLGVELPLPTQILIGVTDAFQTYWWVGFFVMITAIISLRQHLRFETSQVWFNRLRIKFFIIFFFVLMGGVIAFIAVAMMLPIFEANQLLNG